MRNFFGGLMSEPIQTTTADGPAPLLLSRAGGIPAEWVQYCAAFTATDMEREMTAVGHVSQDAYLANFSATYEEALCNPNILHALPDHVVASPWSRAPFGFAGASPRPPHVTGV